MIVASAPSENCARHNNLYVRLVREVDFVGVTHLCSPVPLFGYEEENTPAKLFRNRKMRLERKKIAGIVGP